MGDLAPFIDKACREIIVPSLEKEHVIVQKLSKTHFIGIVKGMVSKKNLKCMNKENRKKEKKLIHNYIKMLPLSPTEEIFDSIWTY